MLDHISYSQINTWMRCNRQWFYRYVLDLKLPPAGALVLGGCYHEALGTNFRQKKVTRIDMPLPDWLDAYSTSWDKRLSDEPGIDWEGNRPGQLKDEGIKLVTAYAEQMSPQVFPLEVEKPYVRKVGGVPAVGVIDLEDEDFVVAEHKTAARAYNQDQVDRDVQLTTYGFFKNRPIDGEFHVAIKPTQTIPARIQCLSTHRTVEDILWWIKGMEQILEQMKTGIAGPRPFDWYCSPRFCGYYDLCHKEITRKYSIGKI